MSAPTIPTDAHMNAASQVSGGVGGPSSTGTHLTSDDQILAGTGGPNSIRAHDSCASHADPGAGGPNSCDAHSAAEDHRFRGVAGPAPTEAPTSTSAAMAPAAAQSAPTPSDTPKARSSAAVLTACPEGSTPPAASIAGPNAKAPTVSLADPFLALAADVVDDLERVRIANENRLRTLTGTEVDSDGIQRGFGLDESHRDVARLAALIDALAKSEHEAVLNLGRHMRKHPLGPWVKAAKGVGEKQAARLLAAIGDPAWNTLTDDWRTLRQLYSYCGYGDAERQVRRRGERANWDADAKMRVYLVASSCIQVGHGDRFRAVYDEGRARYADAVHEQECKRCGPAGHPAQPGSPLSLGHQDGRARRLACKAILRDLWREARRLHGFDDGEIAA